MNQRDDRYRGFRPEPYDFGGQQGPAYEEYTHEYPSEGQNRDRDTDYEPRRERRPLRPEERYGGRGESRPATGPDSRYYSGGMNTGSNYEPSSSPYYGSNENYGNDRNNPSHWQNRPPWESQRQTGNWQEENRTTLGRFAGKGPKSYRRSDERIQEDVNEKLTLHPDIDAENIDVRVQGGEVTLAGSVPSRHAKRLAEDVAEQCFGVSEVRNELRILSASSSLMGNVATSSSSVMQGGSQQNQGSPQHTQGTLQNQHSSLPSTRSDSEMTNRGSSSEQSAAPLPRR